MSVTLDEVLTITKDERKEIAKTIERNEEQINEDIQVIKEWIKKQPHLPQEIDEELLQMMLYLNKYSLEKTKKKIDVYYSVKHAVPEFFEERSPKYPHIKTLLDNTCFMPIPRLTQNCTRVYIFRFLNNNSSLFNMLQFLKMVFGTLDIRMKCDKCLGDEYIADFEHASLGHIVQFTPTLVKKSYTILEKAYSDKIKGVHFINAPPAANVVVGLVNAVLSEKLANRVIVHKNYSSLHKSISKEILPKEYEGNAGPMDEMYKKWRNYFESCHDELEKLAAIRSDEKKRIGEPFDSEMFGMCGSFRKLTLD